MKKIKANKKSSTLNSNLVNSLDLLSSRRTGGAQNIHGLGFQLIYSCYLILKKLTVDSVEIRLEGVEDIDFLSEIDAAEYIQLKTSKNIINASSLWEMNALQNFMEAYKIDSTAKFKLIYNSTFSKGKIQGLTNKKLTHTEMKFWEEKFSRSQIDISSIDMNVFFGSITFEKVTEKELTEQCLSLLVERFKINFGTETQYFNALFNSVFQWAKTRTRVRKLDVEEIILKTTESFSKLPNNPALQNDWITLIDFQSDTSYDLYDYFDGKSAKPIHIANNLPVKRPYWESEIEKSINDFDVTLIKASSDQGKSTLGWLVGKTLLSKGYTVFQLNQCLDWDSVSHLSDFIESRIKIGQIPLIIVDGLTQRVKEWGALAEKLIDRPAKFLITTREEDWIRYSYDLSTIKLKPIEIKLSAQEAQDVYSQLKTKNKLHIEAKNWQEAWEKIKDKGLLIEYVYLLTQGKMITERLVEQIKKLNAENDAIAKIEILRIISLSDVMNIKLNTAKITQYINSTVQFASDRNEVYRQLEKEYYINFNEKYIEGLHPIRSKHIVDILHSHISVAETITSLFSIVDENYIYDFFTSAIFFISNDEKKNVFEKITDLLAKKKFSEIVYAMDGLMQAEAKKYWLQNKTVFDEVSSHSPLELFVYDTLPYTKFNVVGSLIKSMSGNSNLEYLSKNLDKLSNFSTQDSDMLLFITLIKKKIETVENPQSFEGLGFLIKWFKRLNVDFPQIINVTDELLLEAIRNKKIDEAAEIFNYVNITDSEAYVKFVNKNKSEIISIIKKKTNSLTIEEFEKDIHINYLLDNNVKKANESSVHRINIVHEFLPDYEYYCTKAILLPFPNKNLYKVTIQDSIKRMPNKNIQDMFDIHINQIWADAILSNYRLGSIYEWQKQYIDIRILGVEFAKKCTRLFEAYIENNSSRIPNTVNELVLLISKLDGLLRLIKKAPKNNNKYYENEKFNIEKRAIESWCLSITNFINQVASIIAPQNKNDRHLAENNLQDVVSNLAQMQESYQTITNDFFDYFPDSELSKNEFMWYNRLHQTILFYLHKIAGGDNTAIRVVKESVEAWISSNEKQQLEEIVETVKNYSFLSGFKFHLPNKILQKGKLKYTAIGVEGLKLDNDLLNLSIGLIDLDKTEITYFTFFNIIDKEIVNAIRIGKDYFERIRRALQTDRLEDGLGNPMPDFNPSDELISLLPGFKLKKVIPAPQDEAFFKMMFSLNKLTEYRQRLNSKLEIEGNWLIEIEEEYRKEILKEFSIAKMSFSKDEHRTYEKLIDDYLTHKINLSQEEIISHLNNKTQKINNELFS